MKVKKMYRVLFVVVFLAMSLATAGLTYAHVKYYRNPAPYINMHVEYLGWTNYDYLGENDAGLEFICVEGVVYMQTMNPNVGKSLTPFYIKYYPSEVDVMTCETFEYKYLKK